MQRVRPKKQLGQHFLNDSSIAARIVESMPEGIAGTVLEVGPGMGVLTGLLLEKYGENFYAIEIDHESIGYLENSLPALSDRLLNKDFLRIDLKEISSGDIAIIGNFPYNISSQILFKVIEYKHQVTSAVGMLQREVAQRIAQGPGTKVYGILSVLLQAYYNVEYLFTVNEGVFTPPPKVKSAVIRLTRNSTTSLDCDERLFFRVVKATFNQRRKTIRNSLRAAFPNICPSGPYLDLRPERLSVEQFVELTRWVEGQI